MIARLRRAFYFQGVNLQGKNPFSITDFYLLLAVVIWGTTFFFGKISLREISPLSFASLATILSAVLIVPFFLWQEDRWSVSLRHFFWLSGLAFLGTFSNRIFWATGLRLTTASNAALLLATAPIFALLASMLLSRSEVTLRAALGVLIAFGGVSLVIQGDWRGWRLISETFQGDLIMILTAISWALFSVLAKRLLKEYSSLKVTAYVTFIGAIFFLPFLSTEMNTGGREISGLAWFGLFYLAVMGQGLSYFLWVRGIQNIGSLRTMLYQYLIPVTAILLAVPLLQEALTISQVWGAVIVLGGILLARSGRGGSNIGEQNRTR